MNGEEFEEDFEDLNEKNIDRDFNHEPDIESNDEGDDSSWLKDYDAKSEGTSIKKYLEDLEKNKETNNVNNDPKPINIKIKLDENDLKNAWKELEKKGYHLDNIKQEIGTDIRGALYRGYRMNPKSLQKLEHLVGRTILRAEESPHIDTNIRVKVEKAELETVYNELNSQGYSINKISKEINSLFGNALHKGYSMKQESFNKLQQLYGKEITHITYNNKGKATKIMENNPDIKEIEHESRKHKKIEIPENSIKLEESEKLAEFFGISEGDGHIPENMRHIMVSLNKNEEVKYIQYTKNLMEELLNKTPLIRPKKDANVVNIEIHGKNIVGGLVKKGLIPGNKVENQISTAPWISKKEVYKIGNLRGNTDTDGSIFIKKAQKSIRIGFYNSSQPLVKNFKEMCESLNIRIGKVMTSLQTNPDHQERIHRRYEVLIAGKSGVSKFLDIIKPMRWEYRADLLGLTLVSLKNPEKREAIERDLYKAYPDKHVHYNDEYKELLKDLCKKEGYSVSNESIVRSIEDALTNKNTRELTVHGKRVIDDLKQKWGLI